MTFFVTCRHNPPPLPNINNNSNNNGAIFLDRDGTIVTEKMYLRDTTDLEFLPGAVTGLKILAATGLPLYIFTNQAGIAHGYFTEETLTQIHLFLIAGLREAGIEIRAIYYCPHHPLAEITAYRLDCDCRKPKPGLLKMAAFTDQINLAKSYVIGDKLSDLAAGKIVTAKTVLVLTGYGLEESQKLAAEPAPTAPDFIGHDLAEIGRWIRHDLET